MSCIDMNVLNDLRDAIGQKYLTIQQTFLNDTESRLRHIGVLLAEDGGFGKIALNAHAIRSASAYVGGLQLSDLAGQMEMKAQDSDRASVAALFRQMLVSFAATKVELEQAVA